MSHPQAARAIRAIFVIALVGAFVFQGESPQSASAAATLVRMSASGSATGGKRVHIRVVISEPAPQGGLNIPLTSSHPGIIPVPAYAHVNTGATEEVIGITTKPVVDTVGVTVTANYRGVIKQKIITIKEPYHSSLSLQSVIRAGGLGRVVVRLSGRAPTGGITVQLSTDRLDKFDLPSSVTIQPGAASAILKVNATDQPDDVPISVTSHYQKGSINNTYTKNAIIRNFDTPTPTNTPTNTPTDTPTSTPTDTPTSTPTPTDTPTITSTPTIAPTATSTPDPNNPTFRFTVISGTPVVSEGSVVFEVCMETSGYPPPHTINFISSASTRAFVSAGSPHTYTAIGDCTNVTLTDKLGATQGHVTLVARLTTNDPTTNNTRVDSSASIVFPGDPATPTATATATSTTAAAQSAEQPIETSTPIPTEGSGPDVVLSPEGTP